MALTPEDVVNKRFQSTKFREGYDQDEVDDFLDEIVVELRRLNQENDELRQRLVAADARIAELQRGAAAAPAVEAPPAFSAPAPAPVVPAPVPEQPAPAMAPMGGEPTADTNNLLQLARRLHEEHVREGQAKKEALIAEGQAEAARLVAEAASAQQGQLQLLEQERAALQQRVDELRTFEREYRQQLRTYIQGQLAELEGSAQPTAVPSASASASYSSAPVAPAPQQPSAEPAPAASQPYPGSAPSFPGSAPSYPAPAAPAQTYPAPQTPPPGQFPGYGS